MNSGEEFVQRDGVELFKDHPPDNRIASIQRSVLCPVMRIATERSFPTHA